MKNLHITRAVAIDGQKRYEKDTFGLKKIKNQFISVSRCLALRTVLINWGH